VNPSLLSNLACLSLILLKLKELNHIHYLCDSSHSSTHNDLLEKDILVSPHFDFSLFGLSAHMPCLSENDLVSSTDLN